VGYARVTRAQALSLRNQPFVDGAVAIGCTDTRIVLRHILPQLTPVLATLASLNVRPVTGIDLRTSRELDFTGPGPMFDHGAKHYHFPVIDVIDPENLRRQQSAHLMYLEMLESAGTRIRGVFEVLADEGSYPAVFYCAGGDPGGAHPGANSGVQHDRGGRHGRAD
jgi:hypothetical protein